MGGIVSLTINNYNTFNLKVFLQNEDNLTFLELYLTFDSRCLKLQVNNKDDGITELVQNNISAIKNLCYQIQVRKV